MYATRKYLVLIAVATTSTWSFVAFAVVTDLAFTIASIDSMINLWCLVLFDKRIDWLYRIVFKCCANKHVLEIKNTQNTKHLEHSVASSIEAKKGQTEHTIDMGKLELKNVASDTADTPETETVDTQDNTKHSTQSVQKADIDGSTGDSCTTRNTLYASNGKATAVIR